MKKKLKYQSLLFEFLIQKFTRIFLIYFSNHFTYYQMFISLIYLSLSQRISHGRGTINFENSKTIEVDIELKTQHDGQNYLVVLNSNEFVDLPTVQIVFGGRITITKSDESVTTLFYYLGEFQKTYEIPEFIIGFNPAPFIPVDVGAAESITHKIVLLPTIAGMTYYFEVPETPDIRYKMSGGQTEKNIVNNIPIHVDSGDYATISIHATGKPIDFKIYKMILNETAVKSMVFQYGGFVTETHAKFFSNTNFESIKPEFPTKLRWGINDLYFKSSTSYDLTLPNESVLVLAKTNGMTGFSGSYSSDTSYADFTDDTLAIVANSETKFKIKSTTYPTLRVILFNIKDIDYHQNSSFVLQSNDYHIMNSIDEKYHAVFIVNPAGAKAGVMNHDGYEITTYTSDGAKVTINADDDPFIICLKEMSSEEKKKLQIDFVPSVYNSAYVGSFKTTDKKYVFESGLYTKENPDKKGGLSPGATAAIVVVVLLIVIAVVAVLVWFFVFRKKKDQNSGSGENA